MMTLDPNTTKHDLPENYALGETRDEVKVSSAEEILQAANSMASQANYSINIFSQNLDTDIYDNAEFEGHVSNLARKHPNTRIRILVQNSDASARNGHRLIRLAQYMSSSILINKPDTLYQDEKSAFMVVDGLGLIHRVSGDTRQYDAHVNFMSPLRARKLNELFDEVWAHSTPDQQLRRLYM